MSESFAHISSPHPQDNIVDLFCGGGGSGSGILSAYNRLSLEPSGTFVNHWDRAIEIHESNHPTHRHLKEDLFLLDPKAVFPDGQPTKLLWGSPSCQQFSLSRGNRPINEQGRSHADTIPQWVTHLRPEVVIIENVRQFKDYCRLKQRRHRQTNELQWAKEVPGKKKGTMKIKTFPNLEPAHRRQKGEPEAEWELRMIALGYDRHLTPDLDYRGEYFDAWVKKIEELGYVSDYRLLRSADYGDPTIRERLFVMFVRKDTGKRICWPDKRFLKPGAKRPEFKTNKNRTLRPWPTARNSVIDWSHKGTSIFVGRKPLAAATMRRIAIGLVKFGLRDFLVPQSNFGGDRVRSTDEPVSAIQCNHRGEGLATPELQPFSLTSNKGFGDGVRDLGKPAVTLTCNSRGEGVVDPYLIPNFGERTGQEPRTHSLDVPVPAVTSHGAGGLVQAESFLVSCAHGSAKPEDCQRRVSDGNKPLGALTTTHGEAVVNPEPFIVPKDQGHKGDYVTGIDHPIPAVQTTATDHLVEPCIIQANGKSTAISADKPLGAITGTQKQYVMEPSISQLRGTGTAVSVDEPVRALNAQGQHQLLTEAFLLVLDNAGKGGDGQRAFSTNEPVKTVPVKANQTLAEPVLTKVAKFDLETLEDAVRKVAPAGYDVSRVIALLEPLMAELKKAGRVDVRPWVYVYYSNGAVGADIDTPVPTVRCKEGTAVCYPVLEFDGEFMLLDVLYRMLSVKELQRAQGFPSWTWSCKGIACRKQSPTSSESAASKAAAESSEPKSTGASPGKPVGVHARIDFGRSVLVLRSARKSSESAKDAAVFGSYPLPTQIVAFARELAGMLKTQEKAAHTGREATTGQSPIDSTSQRSGSKCETASRSETTVAVESATGATTISLESVGGLSTTSDGGKHGRSIASILRTLSTYVADVMDSCTQEEIPAGSSYSLTLEVADDFVWPEGITKTDIVKAIGNSVSCGVAEALTLAWYSQNEDISSFFEDEALAA